jgi:quercetin dioxygenase-like cupin family protein
VILLNGDFNMNTTSDVNESVIFSKGEKLANDHFTGAAWLDVLVPKDHTFNCPVGNVTFSPGARTNWHRHPGGQLLLVTGGTGYSQEEGKPAKVIQEGQVEKVPPNVKHWH